MNRPASLPTGYELMAPTEEQSTPEFIRSQLRGGTLRPDAVFVPARAGVPARFECPVCHEPLTCWCHVRNRIRGTESPLYYGFLACGCQRKETAQAKEAGRRQATQRRTELLTHNSGLTGRYLNARLENFRTETQIQKDALSMAEAYTLTLTADSLTGLFITGGPMSGKTMLASAVLNEAIRKGMSAYKLTESDYYAGLLDDEKKRDILEMTEHAGILLLDDIGTKRHLTSWNQEQIKSLVAKRDAQNKPTLYTSQYGLADLSRKNWDASTLARIKANSLFVRLDDRGDDTRIVL